MKTLSTSATIYDAFGYVTNYGVTVVDHGDSIQINATEHPKDGLEITADRITSKAFGWQVVIA